MSLTAYQRLVVKQVSGVSCDEDAATIIRAIDRLTDRPSAGWIEVMSIDWVNTREVRVKRTNTRIDADIEEAVDTYGAGLLVQVADVLVFCPEIDPMSPNSPAV